MYHVNPAPRRLAELLDQRAPTLDRLMAVIASIAPRPPVEGDVVTAFDELAIRFGASPATPTRPRSSDVITYAFGRLGFMGDTADYYSPDNSFIHRVLVRRRGIPLTLAAVASEIGRRVDVDLSVVGLPGHVLLGDGAEPTRWFDPFGGGAVLDRRRCVELFSRFHPVEAFDDAMLDPIAPAMFAARMLNNLKLVYHRRGDVAQVARVLELGVALPTSGVGERREYAAVLTALGRYDQAAEQQDALAVIDSERASEYLAGARRLRAHRN